MGLFSKLFAKTLPVESAVGICILLIPQCLKTVHEQCQGRPAPVDDASIANISTGMFLFFLAAQLPYSNDANIPKMARAFQAAWSLVESVGGDEDGARSWFQTFNAGLLDYADLTPDSPAETIEAGSSQLKKYIALNNDAPAAERIAIINRAMRRRYGLAPSVHTPLDILPYTISGAVRSLGNEYKLV